MSHEEELLQDLEAIKHDHDEVFKVRDLHGFYLINVSMPVFTEQYIPCCIYTINP